MKLLSLFFCLFISFSIAHAQEIVERNGYTLQFDSNDPNFDPKLKARMIETFFEVYPRLAADYNPQTLKKVIFKVDTAYKGVAATSNGRVVYSPAWFKVHPEDIDVVTHEVMHIIQNYGRSVGPGWLTEGIADYIRFRYGVDNEGAKWRMPELKPEHHYTNSYRITARFLYWISLQGNPSLVKTVDQSLRDHSYTAAIWEKTTGKTLDQWWEAYTKNPQLN